MNDNAQRPPLQDGDFAPDFTLPNSNGDTTTLSELRGKKIVLYFYPKDDTPGCTTEAIDFTELQPHFAAQDTIILGVSKDTIEKHQKFCHKHSLRIPLLSDEEGSVCEAYDCWVEKNMYGKKYMGIQRDTFLINREGKIAKIWRKVKVSGHAQAVLDASKELG